MSCFKLINWEIGYFYKELWNSLEKNNTIEDVETKKFLVKIFLGFKIDDTTTVVSQLRNCTL